MFQADAGFPLDVGHVQQGTCSVVEVQQAWSVLPVTRSALSCMGSASMAVGVALKNIFCISGRGNSTTPSLVVTTTFCPAVSKTIFWRVASSRLCSAEEVANVRYRYVSCAMAAVVVQAARRARINFLITYVSFRGLEFVTVAGAESMHMRVGVRHAVERHDVGE